MGITILNLIEGKEHIYSRWLNEQLLPLQADPYMRHVATEEQRKSLGEQIKYFQDKIKYHTEQIGKKELQKVETKKVEYWAMLGLLHDVDWDSRKTILKNT